MGPRLDPGRGKAMLVGGAMIVAIGRSEGEPDQ